MQENPATSILCNGNGQKSSLNLKVLGVGETFEVLSGFPKNYLEPKFYISTEKKLEDD